MSDSKQNNSEIRIPFDFQKTKKVHLATPVEQKKILQNIKMTLLYIR
ncbi:MAG: hypothetical protein ACRCWQ_00355 [Bacilli bacterium]